MGHWSASSDVTWTATIGSRPALLFSTLRESLSTRSLTSDILRPPGPPSESCARSGRSRSRSGFGCGGEKWTPALNYVSEAGPASVEDFFLSEQTRPDTRHKVPQNTTRGVADRRTDG